MHRPQRLLPIAPSGAIAAGDANYQVLYNYDGGVIAKLPLLGKELNFGLTPISATYGIVSQENGVLTLGNLTNWTSVGTLQLVDPVTNSEASTCRE